LQHQEYSQAYPLLLLANLPMSLGISKHCDQN